MKKYTVEITETLQKQIEVKANSKEEALIIVKNKYRKGEEILTETDYIDTEFDVIKIEKDITDMKR